MFTNQYVEKVFFKFVRENKGQNEYIQACKEILILSSEFADKSSSFLLFRSVPLVVILIFLPYFSAIKKYFEIKTFVSGSPKIWR